MSTQDDEGADLEALLASPEETGDYDCTVPPEFAGEGEELPEGPAQPLDDACSRQYAAVRQSGRRDLSQIGLIVIHCTQSNSARSSAQWFENTRAQGSAHLVVDDVECYRTLDNEVIPWGAKGANTRGFHIEIAGVRRMEPRRVDEARTGAPTRGVQGRGAREEVRNPDPLAHAGAAEGGAEGLRDARHVHDRVRRHAQRSRPPVPDGSAARVGEGVRERAVTTHDERRTR